MPSLIAYVLIGQKVKYYSIYMDLSHLTGNLVITLAHVLASLDAAHTAHCSYVFTVTQRVKLKQCWSLFNSQV